MSDCKIKLGIVGSRNRALRALTDGGTVYASKCFTDYLAHFHPEDYITRLEIAAKMIRQGPAFCLDGRHGILKLGSIDIRYDEGSGFHFTVASATLIRDPDGKDWAITSLYANDGPMSQNLPPEMYKDLWIKVTPESMASKEDWETICKMTDAMSKDTTYIKLSILKDGSEEK